MSTPNLTIYLQALGGKFLGPHAYNTAEITVTLTYSGGILNIPYAGTDDGNPNTQYQPGATSPFPILTQQTQGNPVVNYLTIDGSTYCAQASVTPAVPFEIATLNISIPTPLAQPLLLQEQVFLSGYNNNMQTVTIPVPGLQLTDAQYDSQTNTASVYVKMMCGCPVSNTSDWPPSDFVVSAKVTYNGSSTVNYGLQLDPSTASLFTGSGFADPGNITAVSFIATQLSTGNFGCAI